MILIPMVTGQKFSYFHIDLLIRYYLRLFFPFYPNTKSKNWN